MAIKNSAIFHMQPWWHICCTLGCVLPIWWFPSSCFFFSEHWTAPRQIGYITVLLPASCAWQLYGGLTVIDMPVDSPCWSCYTQHVFGAFIQTHSRTADLTMKVCVTHVVSVCGLWIPTSPLCGAIWFLRRQEAATRHTVLLISWIM